MTAKLEGRIREKLEEPTRRVGVFEIRNRVHFIDQNAMSVVRFFSGPFKFTLVLLDRVDMLIRQHLTRQRMLMKRHGDEPPLHEGRGHGHGPQEQCLCVPPRIGPTPPA